MSDCVQETRDGDPLERLTLAQRGREGLLGGPSDFAFRLQHEHMSTLATIQHIIALETRLNAEQLPPTRAREELGVDSLAVIEVMFLLDPPQAADTTSASIGSTNLGP